MMCKEWREYDGEYINYEWCEKKYKKCTCSGETEQCDYYDKQEVKDE